MLKIDHSSNFSIYQNSSQKTFPNTAVLLPQVYSHKQVPVRKSINYLIRFVSLFPCSKASFVLHCVINWMRPIWKSFNLIWVWLSLLLPYSPPGWVCSPSAAESVWPPGKQWGCHEHNRTGPLLWWDSAATDLWLLHIWPNDWSGVHRPLFACPGQTCREDGARMC